MLISYHSLVCKRSEFNYLSKSRVFKGCSTHAQRARRMAAALAQVEMTRKSKSSSGSAHAAAPGHHNKMIWPHTILHTSTPTPINKKQAWLSLWYYLFHNEIFILPALWINFVRLKQNTNFTEISFWSVIKTYCYLGSRQCIKTIFGPPCWPFFSFYDPKI